MVDGGVGGVHQGFEGLDEVDDLLAAGEGAAVLLVGGVVDDGAGGVVACEVGFDGGGEDGGLAALPGAAVDVELVAGAGLADVALDGEPGEGFADRDEEAGEEFEVAVEAVADFADELAGEVKGGAGDEVAGLGVAEEVVAGVDDRDEGGLGVATGDDGAGLGLGVDMLDHPAMEGAEAFAAGGGLAPVAEGLAEGQGVFPYGQEGVPYLFRGVVLR